MTFLTGGAGCRLLLVEGQEASSGDETVDGNLFCNSDDDFYWWQMIMIHL